MSSLSEKLQAINDLRREIESLGNLPEDVLKKIQYKFRLECNYHSNRIEGGTLTKPETRSVMIGNITVEGKPLKDIREMRGHDDAMLQILKIGKGEMRLSPSRIKGFHKMIIVEEDPEKQDQIGEWKKGNNEIINYRLEKFNFTDYSLVPEKMQELLNWLNTGLDRIWGKKKNAPDPLLLTFEFQLRYLTIHPFMDGNGRTARLLTNLILVSLGYPPIWVKEGDEKDAYNRYLGDIQGYGGSPELFYGFMADLVLRSLQLTKDAIEGKEIEDVDDWQKKLRLLKSNLSGEDQVQTKKSPEAVINVFEKSVYPCLCIAIEKLSEFDELFMEKLLSFEINRTSFSINAQQQILSIFTEKSGETLSQIGLSLQLKGFKKNGGSPFNVRLNIEWTLEEFLYQLSIDNSSKPVSQKFYHQYYSDAEITEIIKICGERIIEQISSRIEPNK